MRILRLLRSLRLTVVLLVAGAVWAAAATFLDLSFRGVPFLTIMALFLLNLIACTSHRLAYHPHRRITDYMPDAIHVGLIVLMIGAGGSLLARQEEAVILSPGDQFSIGGRYDLELTSTERLPENWVSRFTIVDRTANTTVTDETRVNAPLRIGGYSLFQTSWERVPVLTMVYEDGREYTMAANEGFQAGEDLFVFERVGPDGAEFELVWMRDGEEQGRQPVLPGQQFGGLTVTGTETIARTVITIVRDPAVWLVLFGAVVLSIGLIWYTIERAMRTEES